MKENFKLMWTQLKRKKVIWRIVILTITPIIIGLPIYFSLPDSPNDISGKSLFFLLLLIIIIPALYIIFAEKRPVITWFYLFFIFIWANHSSNEILKRAIDNQNDSKKYISFDYENRHIESSEDYYLFFHGYKTIVMRNKLTGENELF